MKRIKANLMGAILSQCITILNGFVLPRLILEQFGSEVNGLTHSIGQFLGIIGIMDMGLGQVVRSSLYKPLEDGDNQRISCILVSGKKFYRQIAYALLGYVAILLFLYPLLVDQNFGWAFTATLILVIAVNLFSQYYFGVINEQLLHASQKSYLIYSIQIVCTLTNLAVCVGMIRMNCSIHVVKLAASLIFLLKPLIYGIYIRKNYSIDWKIRYDREPIAQKWSGIAQHISAVVLDGTDNIVLTLFSTLSNVSIYSVYYMIIGSIQGFYQSATVSIQSAAGATWAKQDSEKIRSMFFSVETGLHTVTVFLFCCTGILIVPFVRVYTNGLTDTNYIQPLFAAILVLAYGIRCLRTPYNIWILAAGHFKQTQRCHITAAALNLIVSVIAVSRWGLIGVAVGTIIAMCYQTMWMTLYTTRKLVKCPVSHVLKQYFADLLAAAAICATTSWIQLEQNSYVGWFVMAMKVATIALVCIITTSIIFHRKQTILLLKQLLVKIR